MSYQREVENFMLKLSFANQECERFILLSALLLFSVGDLFFYNFFSSDS